MAACEQCGRNQVPRIHAAQTLADWLASHPHTDSTDGADILGQRLVLSLRTDTQALHRATQTGIGPVLFLSGPEGGLSPTEEDLALAHGFMPTTLGPRVLRAETAPLAALAALTLA